MKKSLHLIILVIALLLPGTALFAQDKNVTGVVLSEEGKPLEGITVSVRNTNRRTQTNSVGYFTISARSGQDLVFTSVGLGSQTISVGSTNTVNVTMQPEEKQLGEVIVTALGILKNKKSTGYATSEVKGEEIANTQRDDLLTSLAGRVPGVSITQTTGMPGS